MQLIFAAGHEQVFVCSYTFVFFSILHCTHQHNFNYFPRSYFMKSFQIRRKSEIIFPAFETKPITFGTHLNFPTL